MPKRLRYMTLGSHNIPVSGAVRAYMEDESELYPEGGYGSIELEGSTVKIDEALQRMQGT